MKTIAILILCSFTLFGQYLVSDSKAELQSINQRVHQGIYGSVSGYNASEYFKIDSVSVDTSSTVNQRVVTSVKVVNGSIQQVNTLVNDTAYSYTFKYFALIPDVNTDKRNPQKYLTAGEISRLMSKEMFALRLKAGNL